MPSQIKLFLTSFLILLTSQLFCQGQYPRIEKDVITEKVFHGKVDQYPITISLKMGHFSNYHGGVYSVEGWYHYDKFKTKIPLTGLYSHPELILYSFQDTSMSNELLTFREMKENHWEDMKFYKNLKKYNEKFILSDSESYWMSGSKKLKVHLDREDLAVREVKETLVIDSNTVFDLHEFGGWTWDFEIAAHKAGQFILQFEHPSRLYVMGRCGAGLEKGYYFLHFDENNQLIDQEEYHYESCNGSIAFEKQEDKGGQTIIYDCHDYMNGLSFDIKVDLNAITIEKEVK